MGVQISKVCSCRNLPKDNENEESLSRNQEKKSSQTIDENFKINSISISKDESDSVKKNRELLIENLTDRKQKKGILKNSNSNNDNITNFETNNIDEVNISKKHPSFSAISLDDGSIYTGEIVNGNKNGKGRIIYPNGTYFEGYFKNDVYEGKGILYSENDMKYDGNFVNGQKSGYGIQSNKDKSYNYEGEWLNGLKNGFGKEKYPDGSSYEGSFENGKKNGAGKLWLSNGSIYEGDFKDDKIEGNGYFKWSENQTYQGGWKENCLSGFGTFKKDGKLYKGYFSNDKKHGYGINYYLNTNAYIVGNWIDNNIDGLVIYNCPEKGEQLWKMIKNKLHKIIVNIDEIEVIKRTEEYNKIQNFYKSVVKE